MALSCDDRLGLSAVLPSHTPAGDELSGPCISGRLSSSGDGKYCGTGNSHVFFRVYTRSICFGPTRRRKRVEEDVSGGRIVRTNAFEAIVSRVRRCCTPLA